MRSLSLCWDVFALDFYFCCVPIPCNCFPEVVITARSTELTANCNDFLDAIDNNTINSFFLTESNYSLLFPLLTGSEQAYILSVLQTQSIYFDVEYNALEDATCYLAIPATVSANSYSASDVVAAFRINIE